MIKSSTIERLKNTVDVLDVVERYVELRKAGAVYKGFSPFNEERTPSFTVSPEKRIWHDFSAGVGGDAIKFVMLMENLTFPEAVEKLCDIYGIEVEYESSGKIKRISTSPLEQYLTFCRESLRKNKQALDYLYSRGVNDKSIERFEIGYAPNSIETVEFIRSAAININDAIELGIIDNGNRGLYARFIKRIMFPVRDNSGKLCGFSGRTIVDHPAKYVNTKDTPVFKKSFLLYGLYQAKEAIRSSGNFILSEGQLDVVLQHQAGIENVIASMGTALTEHHVKMISRHATKGVIAYDGDNAGVKAAFRAAELFIKMSVDTKVVLFDNGVDPADMISDGRVGELREMLNNGIPAIDFCVTKIIDAHDIANPFEKQKALDDIRRFASKMMPVIKTSIIEKGAHLLGVSGIIEKKSSASTQQKQICSPVIMKEKEVIKAAAVQADEAMIAELYASRKCFLLKSTIEKLHNNQYDDEEITGLLLDQEVSISADFWHDITVIKLWCMKRFLNAVKSSSSMSYEAKLEKMLHAQAKILELETILKDWS